MLRILPSHESCCTVDGSITDPAELDGAERHLQYFDQRESFSTEIMETLDKKFVERSSRIAQFTPFIGHYVLIRSSGRLRQLVETTFDIRHPIVLDACQTFVQLLLWHIHLKNHHQGINYVRSKVREFYAILKLRSTRRSHCELCRKFLAATIQPIMADLPKERLPHQYFSL